LTEEEFEIKSERHNRDERIREATEQRYRGARASNRCVSTTSTEGALLPSPSGPQLRRSTRSTSGNFQTARYDDAFLAIVEEYGNQSNNSKMAYLSELQTDWDERTINISYPIIYATKKNRNA
jgi:hypothetical protein